MERPELTIGNIEKSDRAYLRDVAAEHCIDLLLRSTDGK